MSNQAAPVMATRRSLLEKHINTYGVKNVANFLASQETEERFKGNKTETARYLATEFAISLELSHMIPSDVHGMRTSISAFSIRLGSIINEVVLFDQEAFFQQIIDVLIARANFNTPYPNVLSDAAFIGKYYLPLCDIKDQETLEYTKHLRALLATMTTIRTIWELASVTDGHDY